MSTDAHPFPRLRDLPERVRAAFGEALSGQTRPLVKGVPMREQDFYFPWDYEDWREGKGRSCSVWD